MLVLDGQEYYSICASLVLSSSFCFLFSIEDVLDFVIYCCYLRSCPFLRLSLLKDVDFKNQETMPWISSFRGRVEFLIAEL